MVYGFAGPRQDDYLLSHLAAVHPDLQGRGLGLRLKQAQAEWARQRGFRRILWTFDPMQSANAKLNIGKLGAVSRRYLEDYYGELDDQLNRGVPTDRLELEWRLDPIERKPLFTISFPLPMPTELKLEWRLRLREQFQAAFAHGLWVVGFEVLPGEALYWLGEMTHA